MKKEQCSSLFIVQFLVLPPTCEVSLKKHFRNLRQMRNFLSLWLNAGAQITQSGRAPNGSRISRVALAHEFIVDRST